MGADVCVAKRVWLACLHCPGPVRQSLRRPMATSCIALCMRGDLRSRASGLGGAGARARAALAQQLVHASVEQPHGVQQHAESAGSCMWHGCMALPPCHEPPQGAACTPVQASPLPCLSEPALAQYWPVRGRSVYVKCSVSFNVMCKRLPAIAAGPGRACCPG